MGLSVDVNIDPDEDLFGKSVDDLQTNVRVHDGAFFGTLKYVDDYSSAFGGDLAHGNYLVFHAEVPDVEGVTIRAGADNLSTLDSDGIIVCRIADKTSQTITVVASKDGYDSVTKEFRLSDLTIKTE